MDDLACPRCRSNLYSPSHDGWSCLDCGYKQRTRGPDAPKVPRGKKTESRFSRMRTWSETRDWKQSKAMWQAVERARPAAVEQRSKPRRPSGVSPAYSTTRRTELNELFKKARAHFEAYRKGGRVADFERARELMDVCLSHADAARNPTPLRRLSAAIRAEVQRRKRA